MELSKVLDGFIDADTLIIKAQVQVIRERADRPFRCLDCQYRRELVRVYLTNVEQICRRFVEERRAKLGNLVEDKARWSSFCAFWMAMDLSSRRRMSREKTESILKVVVKHFFIEKEVTSTLVMDSLYSGLKSLEGHNKGKKSRSKYLDAEELPDPIVGIEKDTFVLVDDVLLLLERAAIEPLPPKDDKGPQNRTKDGTVGEEFNKDSIERDERRLTELGRRTIEIFVLAHIFSKIEVSYQEAVALKKQEELIREEEAAWHAEIEQKARRGAIDKEKKSKKKQGKQKKNNRKVKDKGRDDKTSGSALDKIEPESPAAESKAIAAEKKISLDKSEAVEDVSDASDYVDGVPEIPLPDEDRDASPVNWDIDTSEIHPPIEASGNMISGLSGVQNVTEGRIPYGLDDTSSTCSSDSVPSVRSVQHKGNSHYHKSLNSPTRGKTHQRKLTSGASDWANEESRQPLDAVPDARHPNDASCGSNRVEILSQSMQDKVANVTVQRLGKKEEETSSMSRIFSGKDAIDVETCLDSSTCVLSPSRSPSNSVPPLKSEPKSNDPSGPILSKIPSSDSPKQGNSSVLPTNSSDNCATSKPVPPKISTPRPAEKRPAHQKLVASEKLPSQEVMEPSQPTFATSKPVEKPLTDKPSIPPIPVMSRPLSAPVVPGPRPTVSVVSMVQTAPALARSVSAAGRLGLETTAYGSPSYVPQSYRNAMMGGGPVAAASSSAYPQNNSASSVGNASSSSSHPYSQASTLVSSPLFSPDRMDPGPIRPSLSIGVLGHHDMLQNGALWVEHHPQRKGSVNLHGDRSLLVNEMQSLDLKGPLLSRSQDHLPSEFPACTSGRLNHVFPDEFPHLDIINDLLNEEHGVGVIAGANSDYQRFSGGPQMNRQYTFPGDLGLLNGPSPSASSSIFDRSRNYHDDGFQHGYAISGRSYDSIPGPGSHSYVNGQVDGFMPNQWQMGSSDSPLLSVRSMENDGYPYRMPEYLNLGGYTVFRPSNGL